MQRHAAILARGILQLEERRAVAVQERIRHRLASRDRLALRPPSGIDTWLKVRVSSDLAAT
jgi:hypothetical protein